MNIKELTDYIEGHTHYLKKNGELFDIYEGNLRPYVDAILRETLSSAYYSKMKDRIYPINILRRIIDKLAKVYGRKPLRYANSNQDILEMYEELFNIDEAFNQADEFNNLFKGYAMEPYLNSEGIPSLRVLPFDRFLVESQSIIDPAEMTRFYKYIGKVQKRNKQVDAWLVYTRDSFLAIDAEGDILNEFMQDDQGFVLDGSNPLGFIPFFYSGMSNYKALPTQDTDTLALAKLIPLQVSDLSGTILFQCFTIIYGIDVDAENLTISPNAFWNFRSDPKSDKTPIINTITPTADVQKVLSFIKEVFSMWLESRGIRVGSLGTPDAMGNSSGISKIIDEMDTTEMVKRGISRFKKDERKFWQLVKKMHNHWVDSGRLPTYPRLPENWEVETEFMEPRPLLNRAEQIANITMERNEKIISTKTAIKQLYPEWTDEDIEKEINEIEQENKLQWQTGNELMSSLESNSGLTNERP